MTYRLAWLLGRLVLSIIRRWQVHGLENVPPTGGLIVTANHTSYWDPIIVGCALRRDVHYMAKAQLFKIPLLGPLIRALHAFPVRREGVDRTALKKAGEVLSSGEALGIFPEGTRSHTGELLKPHLGAALLAAKHNVPILPVALVGAPGIGRVKVLIGKPEYPPSSAHKPGKPELERYLDEVMDQIQHLINGARH